MIKGVFIDHRGELLCASPEEMERDFGRRVLTILVLCLQREEVVVVLPNEIIAMICRAMKRDYVVDPVWNFLTNMDYKTRGVTRFCFNVSDPVKYKKCYLVYKNHYSKRFLYSEDEEQYIEFNFVGYGVFAVGDWINISFE